jgi:hypothetical protein
MQTTYSVYEHIFPNNKRFIGITCRKPQYRWSNGNGYTHNDHLKKAIKKYGWVNIQHNILFENMSEEDAYKKEIELINKHQSNNREYGYNNSIGGEKSSAGCKYSDEMKARFKNANILRSIRQKGTKRSEEVKEKISKNNARIWQGKFGSEHPSYGTKRSAETKLKISKARSGVLNNWYGKKSILAKEVNQYTLNNEFIKTWESIKMAEITLNINHGKITAVCKGRRNKTAGFIWRYK